MPGGGIAFLNRAASAGLGILYAARDASVVHATQHFDSLESTRLETSKKFCIGCVGGASP
jgi:hypothetical protein